MIRKYFVPHEDNEYQPHLLQQAAVVGMMVLILITFAVANLQSSFWISSNWLVSTVLPAVIISETNEIREVESLLPLRESETLDQAAQMKAEDMAKGEYFAHHSPDGRSPWYWLDEAGYEFAYAGENLAVHFTDSTEIVEAWLDSPTHRDNILNSNYREIGIGTAKGRYEGYDTVFVVQLFGTPTTEVVASNEPVVIENSDEQAEPISEEVGGVVAGASSEEVAVDTTEEGTVVYSSFAATTTEAEPEESESEDREEVRNLEGSNLPGGGNDLTPNESNSWTIELSSLATKPQTILQISYMFIGLLVLVALLLSVVIEIRRQHPVQIAYGTSLIAVMLLLFFVHISVAGGIVIA